MHLCLCPQSLHDHSLIYNPKQKFRGQVGHLTKMASRPKRRHSKQLPPNLSELMDKLTEEAALFIQQFSTSEPRMREIVEEFLRISNKIKDMQWKMDTVRNVGAVTGGAAVAAAVVIGASIVAAPFTGGMSLPFGAAAIGQVFAASGVAVVAANIRKMMSESGSAKKVEELGKEFMAIVEPMKKNLEEIKMTCEKLEEKSAEAQAENSLTDVEELQRCLRQVSELKEKSAGVLTESVSVLYAINQLLILIVSIFRVTATPENDKRLEEAIIQSADQSQKVVNELYEMRNELGDFTEKTREWKPPCEPVQTNK